MRLDDFVQEINGNLRAESHIISYKFCIKQTKLIQQEAYVIYQKA
jgi:hypothetical protein